MAEEGRVDDMIDGVTSLLDAMAERHALALLEIKRSLKERYGRRSEQISDAQLELLFELLQERAIEEALPALEGAAAELDEAQRETKPSAKQAKRQRRQSRTPFDPKLDREVIEVAVPASEQACATCGEAMACIGHDENEILEYQPASFRVQQIRREKRACSTCRDAVVRAPAPARVVERGRLGTGLIAQVLIAKYLDHEPLYRQRQIYKRHRVDLPRSTLGDAVQGGCELLEPVARRIRERVLADDIVSTDDTGLRVLDRDQEKGAKRGFLWPYLGGDFVWFAYSPSRAGKWVHEVLGEFQGFVQVDGYAGYDALFRGRDCPRTEVGCWMHARRYFVRAVEAEDLRALPVLAQLRALYRVEREAKEAGLASEARQKLRDERSRPLLDELWAWLAEMEPRVPPKSPLGRAIAYTSKRRVALTRFLDDGRLEADNGKVERIIRMVALGRKNYLFAGSDAGAERAAIAYTVLASCALHEIEPWAYVHDVLGKIAAGWPQREIDRLLPDRWAEEHPEALRRNPPA